MQFSFLSLLVILVSPLFSTAAPAAEVYNTDRFAQLYHASRQPPMDNIGLAAAHLIDLFNRNNIPAAMMGGYSLYVQGNPRETSDLDITVRTTMQTLVALLATDDR